MALKKITTTITITRAFLFSQVLVDTQDQFKLNSKKRGKNGEDKVEMKTDTPGRIVKVRSQLQDKLFEKQAERGELGGVGWTKESQEIAEKEVQEIAQKEAYEAQVKDATELGRKWRVRSKEEDKVEMKTDTGRIVKVRSQVQDKLFEKQAERRELGGVAWPKEPQKITQVLKEAQVEDAKQFARKWGVNFKTGIVCEDGIVREDGKYLEMIAGKFHKLGILDSKSESIDLRNNRGEKILCRVKSESEIGKTQNEMNSYEEAIQISDLLQFMIEDLIEQRELLVMVQNKQFEQEFEYRDPRYCVEKINQVPFKILSAIIFGSEKEIGQFGHKNNQAQCEFQERENLFSQPKAIRQQKEQLNEVRLFEMKMNKLRLCKEDFENMVGDKHKLRRRISYLSRDSDSSHYSAPRETLEERRIRIQELREENDELQEENECLFKEWQFPQEQQNAAFESVDSLIAQLKDALQIQRQLEIDTFLQGKNTLTIQDGITETTSTSLTLGTLQHFYSWSDEPIKELEAFGVPVQQLAYAKRPQNLEAWQQETKNIHFKVKEAIERYYREICPSTLYEKLLTRVQWRFSFQNLYYNQQFSITNPDSFYQRLRGLVSTKRKEIHYFLTSLWQKQFEEERQKIRQQIQQEEMISMNAQISKGCGFLVTEENDTDQVQYDHMVKLIRSYAPNPLLELIDAPTPQLIESVVNMGEAEANRIAQQTSTRFIKLCEFGWKYRRFGCIQKEHPFLTYENEENCL